MLVVVSPAKKLDMTPHALPEGQDISQPDFADDARYLADVAGRFDVSGLMALMGISEKLASLNKDRFHAFGAQESKPAAFAFAGDTYLGLEAKSLEAHHIAWAQNHLRILSGLYGILRPLDVIEPYRLEMGSKLATNKGANLYAYWGTRIADALREQAETIGAKAVVNCASQEYFGAVDIAALGLAVITPVFKNIKAGKARIVSFYAKQARGAMARFIIENEITDRAELHAFSYGGYRYQPDLSSGDEMVFTRLDPNG